MDKPAALEAGFEPIQNQELCDSDSDLGLGHDTSVSDLETKLKHLEIQALSNQDMLRKMSPQDKCSTLAFKASCAVVVINCWKKIRGTSTKDMNEFVYSTGFIINSRNSTLIMTCAQFLDDLFRNCSIEKINSNAIISVGFFDKKTKTLAVTERETLAKIVYLDFANDICLLQADEANQTSMVFGGLDYESNENISGMTVCAVSHPICHNVIQYYIFTIGKMGQRCLPVPSYRLEANCDCLVYDVPMNSGCSGGPIFDYTGSVIAFHSSFDECLNFGIGLKSIKKALLRYFGLPKKHCAESTNEVLRLGLEKQAKNEFAPLSYKLNKPIFDSDSDLGYDSSVSDVENKLHHLEIQALFNEHCFFSMVPQDECYDLANQASSAIVVVRCWKKLPGSSITDLSECISCTGFIINSNENTLIMSCAHFLLEFFGLADEEQINREAIISVEFFDTTNEKAATGAKEILAEVVLISYTRDMCLLTVNVGEKDCVVFGGSNYENDEYLKGLVIWAVSHPVCYGVIQPYIFTMGRMSQSCFPVPDHLLTRTCHCLVYALPSCSGSSGAPIFDHTGVVIAIHSSNDNALCFGVGLRSIKWGLMKYFKLSRHYYDYDANEILKAGLAKQRATSK